MSARGHPRWQGRFLGLQALLLRPHQPLFSLGIGDAVIHSVMSGRTVELDTISERQAKRVRFGDPTP